jgi:hypothetical protein
LLASKNISRPGRAEPPGAALLWLRMPQAHNVWKAARDLTDAIAAIPSLTAA